MRAGSITVTSPSSPVIQNTSTVTATATMMDSPPGYFCVKQSSEKRLMCSIEHTHMRQPKAMVIQDQSYYQQANADVSVRNLVEADCPPTRSNAAHTRTAFSSTIISRTLKRHGVLERHGRGRKELMTSRPVRSPACSYNTCSRSISKM
jgi:hypothetical protein